MSDVLSWIAEHVGKLPILGSGGILATASTLFAIRTHLARPRLRIAAGIEIDEPAAQGEAGVIVAEGGFVRRTRVEIENRGRFFKTAEKCDIAATYRGVSVPLASKVDINPGPPPCVVDVAACGERGGARLLKIGQTTFQDVDADSTIVTLSVSHKDGKPLIRPFAVSTAAPTAPAGGLAAGASKRTELADDPPSRLGWVLGLLIVVGLFLITGGMVLPDAPASGRSLSDVTVDYTGAAHIDRGTRSYLLLNAHEKHADGLKAKGGIVWCKTLEVTARDVPSAETPCVWVFEPIPGVSLKVDAYRQSADDVGKEQPLTVDADEKHGSFVVQIPATKSDCTVHVVISALSNDPSLRSTTSTKTFRQTLRKSR